MNNNINTVEKGKVATSTFLIETIQKIGENRKFTGTFTELEEFVQNNIENWEPGIGSKNGDVRIINLPTKNFFTDVIEINDDNKLNIEVSYNPRRVGELPIPTMFIRGGDLEPAEKAQVVIYRYDVLAQDNDRSSEAEWEIVAILTEPKLPEGINKVPMNPYTMARNNLHEKGGTYREYTNKEWAESIMFWGRHAHIIPE